VSRETRLLLMTMLMSVVVLVALARIRFPQRPVTPNIVSPLLAQLTSASPFEALASSPHHPADAVRSAPDDHGAAFQR
jgi:hypothetical protein